MARGREGGVPLTKGPDVFEDLTKVCALAEFPNVGVPSLSNSHS